MIKEAYVSYETAELLKEKGFNEATNRYYNAQYDETRTVSDTFMTYWNNENHMKVLMMEGALAIPTHQMACAWLREVHNIDIEIRRSPNTMMYRCVVYKDTLIKYITDGIVETYEEAVEAALKYSLENLI